MSVPSVRTGQRGNASLTSATNNQTNLLNVGAGRRVAPAQQSITPLVIWNLQVL